MSIAEKRHVSLRLFPEFWLVLSIMRVVTMSSLSHLAPARPTTSIDDFPIELMRCIATFSKADPHVALALSSTCRRLRQVIMDPTEPFLVVSCPLEKTLPPISDDFFKFFDEHETFAACATALHIHGRAVCQTGPGSYEPLLTGHIDAAYFRAAVSLFPNIDTVLLTDALWRLWCFPPPSVLGLMRNPKYKPRIKCIEVHRVMILNHGRPAFAAALVRLHPTEHVSITATSPSLHPHRRRRLPDGYSLASLTIDGRFPFIPIRRGSAASPYIEEPVCWVPNFVDLRRLEVRSFTDFAVPVIKTLLFGSICTLNDLHLDLANDGQRK